MCQEARPTAELRFSLRHSPALGAAASMGHPPAEHACPGPGSASERARVLPRARASQSRPPACWGGSASTAVVVGTPHS